MRRLLSMVGNYRNCWYINIPRINRRSSLKIRVRWLIRIRLEGQRRLYRNIRLKSKRKKIGIISIC